MIAERIKDVGGRPPIFNQDDIIRRLDVFIVDNDDPLIVEFCVEYGISSTRFYEIARDNAELAYTLKRATDKQEAYLVRNAQNNKINPIFSMFRLKQKQFGWADKQEIEITGPNGGPLLIQAVNAYSDDDLKAMEEIMARSAIQGDIVDIESK